MEVGHTPNSKRLLTLTSFDEIESLRLGLGQLRRPSLLRRRHAKAYENLEAKAQDACFAPDPTDTSPITLTVEETAIAAMAFAKIAEALTTLKTHDTGFGVWNYTTGSMVRDAAALAVHVTLEATKA